jgi:hypothetical protein
VLFAATAPGVASVEVVPRGGRALSGPTNDGADYRSVLYDHRRDE